jgi:hypothetical protein
MTQLPEVCELPDGWQDKEAELVSHNTLHAVYQLEGSGKTVRIIPKQTGRLAQYTNSHKVILETPENGEEVIAEGKEVDDVHDAKLTAVEAMKQV